MKKILILFSAVGLLSLTGCNNDDDVVVAPAPVNQVVENEVFQVGPVNFTFDTSINMYSLLYDLDPQIEAADMVLVYRRTFDPGADNTPVWQLIPRTLHDGEVREIDYDYNFDQTSILFTVDANFDLSGTSYLNNQIFRVVILPGYDSSARFDFTDYNAVAAKYNLKESDVKILR